MKTLLRIEELGIFVLAIFLFSQTAFVWWWFPLLLLVPDVSMVGYLFTPGAGSVLYNIFHHKAIAVVLYIVGYIWSMPVVELAGIILLAHAAMDRIFGYGLKYADAFKHTHLGWIGK